MRWRPISFLLYAILFIEQTFAQNLSADKLFFPVEKNNVQILAQRFEYQLLDKDRLQIGDIPINADEIDFQLIPINKQRTLFKIRFRWPLSLFESGELVLKDNSGKAIWNQKIEKAKLKKSKSREQAENSRADLAVYETTDGVDEILKALKMYPFFNFCMQRSEDRMRLTMCSKDLYLLESKTTKNRFKMATRDSLRPESYVDINGRKVDPQGVIFLNSPEEFLSLRGRLLSGASLELETRMKAVEFKDVLLTEDGKHLIVRAEGAEPVNPSLVKKRGPGSWEAQLDVDRPTTYLKGEGDIPLRQEFLIKGAVRKESIQVSLTSNNINSYEPVASVLLVPSEGSQLINIEKNSALKKEGKNYRWTLTQLKNNDSNRRYIKVQSPQGEFIAGYDFPKFPARDAQLRLMAPLWLQTQIQWNWNTRWSSSLSYDKQMVKAADEPNLQYWTVAAQYRLTPGVLAHDPSWKVEAFVISHETDVDRSYLLGPGITAELKSPSWYSQYFPWTHLKARFPMMSSQSESKLKQGIDVDLELRHYVHDANYWAAGARYQLFKFENSSEDYQFSGTYLFVGLGWLF